MFLCELTSKEDHCSSLSGANSLHLHPLACPLRGLCFPHFQDHGEWALTCGEIDRYWRVCGVVQIIRTGKHDSPCLFITRVGHKQLRLPSNEKDLKYQKTIESNYGINFQFVLLKKTCDVLIKEYQENSF